MVCFSSLVEPIMFFYELLYYVDKGRGSERMQRDDEKQMEYICLYFCVQPLTAPFSDMQTLKFKVQPTNMFFATVNQMFGSSFQLPTSTGQCLFVWIMLIDLITTRSAEVGSWGELPNIWLTVAKNTFVSWALNLSLSLHVIEKCSNFSDELGWVVSFWSFYWEDNTGY